MGVDRAINIEDLHQMAKRHLPRLAFDFIEGGVEDERGLARNEEAFRRWLIMPRYCVDVSKRDQTLELFGQTYASPFGFAPTGTTGYFRANADLMLAQAAAEARIPYIQSGASNADMESCAIFARETMWYQIYAAHDPKVNEDFVRRADAAGLGAIVVTVDVPVRPRRERNLRTGFTNCLRATPSIMLDALEHPAWLYDFLTHGGIPTLGNWVPYAPKGADARGVVAYFNQQVPAPTHGWHEIETYRRHWKKPLIIKGILHPDDARRAVELGCDGIIVSNHGARQLDRAPAALDALPGIVATVGDKAVVMVDSGVRRGTDVLVALALGAKFVWVGRAAVYGVSAGALAGARKAIEILRREIDLNMGQMGCPSLADLDRDFVREAPR
ncbi:MAG: alpha-hydroxy-acid oxidizing protein [Alphaproteobacteria bacterium]|nr:alpha-hydroxy-acid oxidizing protein [Alphaproteobacteria bacterium]